MAFSLLQIPQEILFSYAVKGSQAIMNGRIVNGGGSSVTKAFLAVVRFYAKDGTLMEGPYAGLSTSRIGSYKYLPGGSASSHGQFSIKVKIPKKATRMDVAFSAWDSKDVIQFLSYPTIELHAAEKKAAA
jgi:hypothetical protein